jgi:hypothetical protein
MHNSKLLGALALFGGALAVSWITHGTGVVRDDPERHISIPAQLTMPLYVQAAYNDSTVFIRYRWPAERPGILHDVLRYEDGEWIREGRGVPGSEPDGLHEDRVAMMLDDGSVPEFSRYGGYITVGAGLAGLTDEAPEEVTKYLPATRTRPGQWGDMVPDNELAQLRAGGYFLDLWHWRAARSNPVGESDDQYVSSARSGDEGSSTYSTNWDGDLGQPKVMFDAAKAGHKALKWDDIQAGAIAQDSVYALVPDVTVPFDPDADWENGDVLPRRIVKPGTGSRGDISVAGEGRWSDGYWDVTLSRALDTGNPRDDKILHDHRTYDVAFAVHRDATGGRWHYVSLPQRLGLAHEGNIMAMKFQGLLPEWGEDWSEITLFYPGQVTWPMLISETHAGAEDIAQGIPVSARHSPEQLANYGIEHEFRDEIRSQWMWTLLGGVVLIFTFGVALSAALSTRQGE